MQERNLPGAVCEACSLVWALGLIGGATYLVVDYDWSLWTYVGTVVIMCLWSCRLWTK